MPSSLSTTTLTTCRTDPLQSGSFALFKSHGTQLHYQPGISMQIPTNSQSPRNSGDYAEIGPALATVQTQSSGLHSVHDYSEIPPFAHLHSQSLPSQDQEPNPYLVAHQENPYDTIPPPTAQDSQGEPRPQDTEEHEGENGKDADEEEGVILSATRITPDSIIPNIRGCDVHSTQLSIDGLSESSLLTPPQSPHEYHTLEEGGTSSQPCPPVTVHTDTFPVVPTPLETIPEHPLYTLESSSGELTLDSTDEGTPADPGAIRFEEFTDISLSPTALSLPQDDGGYDKLIGPPHLLQVLQRSPSAIRPRLRDIPQGYSCLVPTSINNTSMCSTESEWVNIPEGGDQDAASLDSMGHSRTGGVFDDPQYAISPQRKSALHRSFSTAGAAAEAIQAARVANGTSGCLDAAELSKYLGDYERDPAYMHLLKRSCDDVVQSNLARKRLSLPHLPHIYQPLESRSIEPKQHYESLQQAMPVGKETAI